MEIVVTWCRPPNPLWSLGTIFPMTRALFFSIFRIISKRKLFYDFLTFVDQAMLPGTLTWFFAKMFAWGTCCSCLHHHLYGVYCNFYISQGMKNDLLFNFFLLWHFESMINFNGSTTQLSHRFDELNKGIFRDDLQPHPFIYLDRFCSAKAGICIIGIVLEEQVIVCLSLRLPIMDISHSGDI